MNNDNEKEVDEYNSLVQSMFIGFLVADKELFSRCHSITKREYFDAKFRKTVDFIKDHVEKYNDIPAMEQIQAVCNYEVIDCRSLINEFNTKWFMDRYEGFCRYKALEIAIFQSSEDIINKDFTKVGKLVKDALEIGLPKDFGTNYWEDPFSRIEAIRDAKGQNITGWTQFDKLLYGGFNIGELNIFAGGSGSGKSLFMQNLALTWALQGKNCVYITLELSEALCSNRIDAMLTGKSTLDVIRNPEETAIKVKMTGNKSGRLQIVGMKNGCNVNDIMAYIKEFQLQHEIKVDALMIDYLDLMMPAGANINPSDLFSKDKYVSEELRNLARELNILFVTASQLNRQSVDEVELSHSHIAGGLSKIQTADNVIGIFTSRAMREKGKVQLQFMKTRSSNGVGQNVDLAFNINSLRITDLPDDYNEKNEIKDVYDDVVSRNKIPKGEGIDSDRVKNMLKH